MIHLNVTNLHRNFGGLHVFNGVNLEVNGPELIGVLGPNGAGKTTLTNILEGAIKPTSETMRAQPEGVTLGYRLHFETEPSERLTEARAMQALKGANHVRI